MTKTRVAVIRGGPSLEYDISMQTGVGVLKALQDTQFYTKDIVVSKKGEWLCDGFTKTPDQALSDIDVVFIALHGEYGEDGTIQRILERLNVPYTGSAPYASGIAMNKTLTKEFLKSHDITVPKQMRLTRDGVSDSARTAQSIAKLFGPQYFLKPEKGGSSIGAILVENESELANAITQILATYPEIIVEERIVGREATVGILENFRDKQHYKLPVIEIIPPKESKFFAADVKYTGQTQEVCPGNFSRKQKDYLENTAKSVHKALNLSHFSRSDFIVTDTDVYFLEVNTLPGLTEQSLYPKSMEAVGSNYKELISHLLTLALQTKR